MQEVVIRPNITLITIHKSKQYKLSGVIEASDSYYGRGLVLVSMASSGETFKNPLKIDSKAEEGETSQGILVEATWSRRKLLRPTASSAYSFPIFMTVLHLNLSGVSFFALFFSIFDLWRLGRPFHEVSLHPHTSEGVERVQYPSTPSEV